MAFESITAVASSRSTVGSTVEGDSFVDGVVLEVLAGFGLAHVRSDDGRIFGISRAVVGQALDAIRESQRVRLRVLGRFYRVIEFHLL